MWLMLGVLIGSLLGASMNKESIDARQAVAECEKKSETGKKCLHIISAEEL